MNTIKNNTIILGTEAFDSYCAAYCYVKKLIRAQEPGEFFDDDEEMILRDVVKHDPGYTRHGQPPIIGFTVGYQKNGGDQQWKMLVVIAIHDPKGGKASSYGLSVDKCFTVMANVPMRVISHWKANM